MGKNTLNVDSEQVGEIAALTRQVAAGVGQGDELKSAKLDTGSFGGFESSADLVAIHRAAHDVVTKTLAGVQQDLENFAGGLETAVSDLLASDALAESALNKLLDVLPMGPGTIDLPSHLDANALSGLSDIDVSTAADQARNDAIADRDSTEVDG